MVYYSLRLVLCCRLQFNSTLKTGSLESGVIWRTVVSNEEFCEMTESENEDNLQNNSNERKHQQKLKKHKKSKKGKNK